MAAKTPTTAHPRPLYRSILAPALEEEEDEDEPELDVELLLEELLVLVDVEEDDEAVLLLLVPLTLSQISETTLLVAVLNKVSIECFFFFSFFLFDIMILFGWKKGGMR